MKFHKKKSAAGFTVIEVLAATVIILPLLVVLMGLAPGLLKNRQKTEASGLGPGLAAQKMEEIRRQVMSNDVSYGYARNYNQTATSFPSPLNLFSFSVTDDQGASQKLITVSVWKAGSYTLAVADIIAKRT